MDAIDVTLIEVREACHKLGWEVLTEYSEKYDMIKKWIHCIPVFEGYVIKIPTWFKLDHIIIQFNVTKGGISFHIFEKYEMDKINKLLDTIYIARAQLKVTKNVS